MSIDHSSHDTGSHQMPLLQRVRDPPHRVSVAQISWRYNWTITLWLFNIAMGNGPFIDGLPINSMVIFHGYVSHNQMVDEHEL